MKSKKIMIALLALILAFTVVLSACNNGGDDAQETAASGDAGANKEDAVYKFTNERDETVELGEPEKELDPELVYSQINYIPEMFYGIHQLIGGESVIEHYKETMSYYKFNEANPGGGGVEREITTIPYKIDAKPQYLANAKDSNGILQYLEAYFYNADGDMDRRKFLYSLSVSNKTHYITLKEITDVKYDENYEKIVSYEETDLEFKYKFSFRGNTLTLKKGDDSLDLGVGYIEDSEEPRISTDMYLTEGSNAIDRIVSVQLYKSADNEMHSIYIVFVNEQNEEEQSYYCYAEMSENGLLTFAVPYADKTKTYQYVYFYLDDYGLILTDGEENHLYTMKQKEYLAYKLGTVLDDDYDVDALSDSQQKDLIVKQNAILGELEEAFKSKNIDANVDKETGRVTMDSQILFDSDSYALSAEGKKSLDEFIDVYTSVVLSDDNKDTVSSVVVEGHTDTNGTHEYNQELSEKRADAVAKYCIEQQPKMKDIIESKGYSFDYPVYNEDGTVNMDASRRVVFKFKLKVNPAS